MTLKEKLKNSEYLINENDINCFDYIYFIPTRRKHDSGYYIFEIYGGIYNRETKEEKYYNLSKCSDVIDFEKITCLFQWFSSIDMPEYNVYRIFPRRNHKFVIPFYHCSSFMIDIIEDKGE